MHPQEPDEAGLDPAESEEVETREMPAWLLGLFVAIVIFAGFLFALYFMGFGDDPSIGIAKF